MKKAILIVLVIILCVAIGFFMGSKLNSTDNSEWQEQYDLGVRYLSEGKYDEAIIAFTAAINIDPYETSAFMRRIEAYAAVGGEDNYRKAIQDCKTVLSINDKLTSVWLAGAQLIEQLDGPEAALDFLRPGLEATEGADKIADKIRALEEKLPNTVPTEAPMETLPEETARTESVADEENVPSDAGISSYLGANIDTLVNQFGHDYVQDYWEGGRYIKFTSGPVANILFFYDQTTNEIFNIVCGYSETIVEGITVDMTYTQLREALLPDVVLEQPNGYYNQMDEQNEYLVSFSLGGLNISYTWLDDPFENKAYTVSITGTPTQNPEPVNTDTESAPEPKTLSFSEIPSEFIFTSGAGAWSTNIVIASDGSFEGSFHDSNMGETGEGYPNGTVYYCDVMGRFTTPVQVSQYVYRMELQDWDTADAGVYSYIENGIQYIASTPHGFDGSTEYYLYLPGIPASMMPEACYTWVKRLEGGDQGICNSYVICSANGDLPFVAMS